MLPRGAPSAHRRAQGRGGLGKPRKHGRREARARALQGDGGQGLRSEVNIELNFPPELRGARSRLYRRRFLQVNTRWKALAEIYTMHSFAPFSNLIFFVKNRQKCFAIELLKLVN